MDLRPVSHEKVGRLIEKGVRIPNPVTLDIGDEVDPERISGDGVIIHPGCRIHGAKTVISAGVQLGEEAPVTVEDCALGPGVELKGGYFRRSVFLDKVVMGSGAQVREACLMEEQASGAHCVGLKQTILLPFVTLGSLVNFCDCLMAGGTGRRDHSEVGSSYIHFNYTPGGDKATASLFGDVPRGVMLDRPPIFLGGQGGAVGPVRVGYGTVIAAGSILREDSTEDNKLVVAAAPRGLRRDIGLHPGRNLTRVVRNNLLYLGNLAALERWYGLVRQPFFAQQPLGPLVFESALAVIVSAKQERSRQLEILASSTPEGRPGADELRRHVGQVCAVFDSPGEAPTGREEQEFLGVLPGVAGSSDYIKAIRGLSEETKKKGTAWLQAVVDGLCRESGGMVPSLDLFTNKA